jgi:hypothetical protein
MSELLALVGLSTGVVMYAVLLAMVLRAGRAPGMRRHGDPLLLVTAVLGLVWNVCAVGLYERPKYAVRAFELNAVDYLLKPVTRARLRDTLGRANERVEHAEILAQQATRVGDAIASYEAATGPPYLERIPVRRRDQIAIVPVTQIASIVADGELLVITTTANERHTMTYRLKDLERGSTRRASSGWGAAHWPTRT